MVPLLLFSIGAGGAWIGTLVRLAPFQPYFIATAIGCLCVGYWLVYRSRVACADRETCATSPDGKLVKGVLALSTLLVILAVGFNFIAPLLSS
jgi:mercuric ion transport protein